MVGGETTRDMSYRLSGSDEDGDQETETTRGTDLSRKKLRVLRGKRVVSLKTIFECRNLSERT